MNERDARDAGRDGRPLTATRREVLRWTGGLALGAAAGGLIVPRAGAQTPAVPPTPTKFVEPPFFKDRVASGKLPPIEQRLPKEPFVVGPGTLLQDEWVGWQNGQYGGGDITVAATFSGAIVNIAGGATILRSPSQTTEPSRPNVVSEFSASPDYTTFRFKIRDGLKWSDGTPVTTEDIRFTYEDLYQDPTVQMAWPTTLYTQGNPDLGPAKLNIIDNLTFELVFSKPYGYLLADLNSWITYHDFIFKPAHYLKQFHARYAKAADLAALVKQNKAASWADLLKSKAVSHWDLGDVRAFGMPMINAWVLTEATESRHTYERNPYFWHVDSDGRQLPYIDRVIINVVGDQDAISNAILAGQSNLATSGEVALNKMPIYQQNADKSGLRVFTTGSFNYPLSLFLNHDYEYDKPGSAWQTLITDPQRRFGKALAAGMDPADVSQSVYFGLYGTSLLNSTGHNPDLANQLLDALGMNKRGPDNFRLGPAGQPFVLRITNDNDGADFAPVATLLKNQLGSVGIHVEIENISVQLFNQRKATNSIMASLYWNDGNAWQYGISEDYLPTAKGPWSPMTWLYFTTNGKQGRKPPEYIQQFYNLHTSRKAYPPQSDQGKQLFQQLLQWMSDNYVFIPTAGKKVAANVVSKRLRNTPKDGAPYELDTYINAEGYWFAGQ